MQPFGIRVRQTLLTAGASWTSVNRAHENGGSSVSGEQLRADVAELAQTSAAWLGMVGELHPGTPPHPGTPIWPTAIATGAIHSGVQISTTQLAQRLTGTADSLAGATDSYADNEKASADALNNVTGPR
jgi:hypothetical protein